jgi:hypothetical protein
MSISSWLGVTRTKAMRINTAIKKIEQRITPKRLLFLHITITLLFILFFWYITETYIPLPISDFQYYWDLPYNMHEYVKGGIIPLMVLPFRLLNISAPISAFTINSIAWLALSYVLWVNNKGNKSVLLQLTSTITLFCIGFWWTGLTPIINSDLIYPSLTVLGMYFILTNLTSLKIKDHVVPIIFFTLANITRTVGIIFFVILCAGIIFIRVILNKKINEKQKSIIKKVIIIILASILLAVSINIIIKEAVNNDTNIKVYNRLIFYDGILSTSPGYWCGAWSAENALLAEQDVNLSFADIFKKYTSNKSLSYYDSIVLCKFKRIIHFDAISFFWLKVSVTEGNNKDTISNNDIDTNKLERLNRYEHYEGIAIKVLKAIILLLLLYGLVSFKPKAELNILGIFPILIYLSFVIIHLILETHARYFIGPTIFTLVCALYLIKEKHNLLNRN